LCSATLTGNPQKLAALALWKPILVDSAMMKAAVGEEGTDQDQVDQRLPNGLTELGYRVTLNTKPMGLLHVISMLQAKDEASRVLIFVSSVERASKIHSLLRFAFGEKSVVLLTSELSRQQRSEALEKFKSRKLRLLVASDLAARGIDVPDLEYVLSYDVPRHEVTYVHRAGRTARAGHSGTSIVLLQREEFRTFNSIKRKLKSNPIHIENITNDDITKFAETFQAWKRSQSDASDDILAKDEDQE
jgi:ATP-dependent RNA helicase DDX51/DBP6